MTKDVVSAPLVSRIETGHPTVPPFTPDLDELGRLATTERSRLALLPQRVRAPRLELDR